MDNIIGYKKISNEGLVYTVIEKSTERYKKMVLYIVEFDETGYRTLCRKEQILKGTIKDRYHPSVVGVGYLGDIKNFRKEYWKEYRLWTRMLTRCYKKGSHNFHHYGEKGVSVCERWLCFKNFLEDIPLIEGYEKELFKEGKLQLDKDMKQQGKEGKIYSLEYCTFFTQEQHIRVTMGINFGIWG